jgi:hypothetical protein
MKVSNAECISNNLQHFHRLFPAVYRVFRADYPILPGLGFNALVSLIKINING